LPRPSRLRAFAPSRLRAFAPSRLRAFAPSRLRAFAPSRLRAFASHLSSLVSYGTDGPANFTFLTVKESGHMVPQYQPARALAFFQAWVKGDGY
jgi:hypothetical protein